MTTSHTCKYQTTSANQGFHIYRESSRYITHIHLEDLQLCKLASMDGFTIPSAAPTGQCRLPEFPQHHQLGFSSPPPWFVAVTDDGGAPCGGGDLGQDEKMDMLWEDFNEELARTPPVCPLSPLHKGELMMMKEEAWPLDDCGVGLVVAGTEKRGRHPNAGSVVRRRRWSLLLMLRLLKKLFLVRKSRNQRTARLHRSDQMG